MQTISVDELKTAIRDDINIDGKNYATVKKHIGECKQYTMYPQYVIGERGVGKTRQLLEEAHNHNAIVVCKNPDAMRVKAQNYGFYRMNIIGYDNINDLNNEDIYVIDELEEFLNHFLCGKMYGFTLTVE